MVYVPSLVVALNPYSSSKEEHCELFVTTIETK
jgi:hypothetical protein